MTPERRIQRDTARHCIKLVREAEYGLRTLEGETALCAAANAIELEFNTSGGEDEKTPEAEDPGEGHPI